MPFPRVYVWTPPGSSGRNIVFGLSDDKDWWAVTSVATSTLNRCAGAGMRIVAIGKKQRGHDASMKGGIRRLTTILISTKLRASL
jgi:hypothetical protein